MRTSFTHARPHPAKAAHRKKRSRWQAGATERGAKEGFRVDHGERGNVRGTVTPRDGPLHTHTMVGPVMQPARCHEATRAFDGDVTAAVATAEVLHPVYTWGYSKRAPSDLATLLDELGAVVIDTRHNPHGSSQHGWTHTELQRALGDRYVQLGAHMHDCSTHAWLGQA
jgi:hypothetical protein